MTGGGSCGLTTRQYARLVQEWAARIGLDPAKFGMHSLRRTKAVLIYDAIEIAEKIDI